MVSGEAGLTFLSFMLSISDELVHIILDRCLQICKKLSENKYKDYPMSTYISIGLLAVIKEDIDSLLKDLITINTMIIIDIKVRYIKMGMDLLLVAILILGDRLEVAKQKNNVIYIPDCPLIVIKIVKAVMIF